MERIALTSLDSYLDAMTDIYSLGIRNYYLVGYNDTMRLVISQRKIKSSVLHQFLSSHNCDIRLTMWGNEPSLEITLMKDVP